MFLRFFIVGLGCCLAGVWGVYGTPPEIELPWSHETEYCVTPTAFRVGQDNNRKINQKWQRECIPDVYIVKKEPSTSMPCLFNVFNSFYCKPENFRAWINRQKTPEGRKTFFEQRMEVFRVPDTDPRVDLGGQRGVRATCDIPKGTPLGIPSGIMYHTEWGLASIEKMQELACSRNKEELEPRMTWAASPKDLLLYYEGEFGKNQSQGNQYEIVIPWEEHRFTLAPNCGQLGPMDLINSIEKGQDSNSNVARVCLKLSDHSFPVAVALSTKNIQAGEELLEDYLTPHISYNETFKKDKGISKKNHETIQEIYKFINEMAAQLEIQKQLQILPEPKDRELKDWFSLFTPKRTR